MPGKPIQYATTENFLSHFNFKNCLIYLLLMNLGAAGLIDSAQNIDDAIFGTGKFYKEKQVEKKEEHLWKYWWNVRKGTLSPEEINKKLL